MVLGTKNGYRRRRWFQNQFFFFLKKNVKTDMALSTSERAGQGPARWPLPIITQAKLLVFLGHFFLPKHSHPKLWNQKKSLGPKKPDE
jgi:hypothetical protein